MFTGIVEEVGTIRSVKKMKDGLEIYITAKKVLKGVGVDNSIAVNGVCLTVVKKTPTYFVVQVVKETMLKSSLKGVKEGNEVNLERSVKLYDRLGGHLVQGHVDTTGTITRIDVLGSSWMYTVRFPSRYRKYLISVGSISLDGTSLTVARLNKRNECTIAIIPYTYVHTIFHSYRIGTRVNLEFDIIGKYIESIMKYGNK